MDALPPDIWVSIFGDWMHIDSILTCRLVCKSWNTLIENNSVIWEKVHFRYLYSRNSAVADNHSSADSSLLYRWIKRRTAEIFRSSEEEDCDSLDSRHVFNSLCRYHRARIARVKAPIQQPFEGLHEGGVRYLEHIKIDGQIYLITLGWSNEIASYSVEQVGEHWQLVTPAIAKSSVRGHIYNRFSIVNACEIAESSVLEEPLYLTVCTGGRANESFKAHCFRLPTLDVWDSAGAPLRSALQLSSLYSLPLSFMTIAGSGITGQPGILLTGRNVARYFVPDMYNPQRKVWSEVWAIDDVASLLPFNSGEVLQVGQPLGLAPSGTDVIAQYILAASSLIMLVQKSGKLVFIELTSGQLVDHCTVLSGITAVCLHSPEPPNEKVDVLEMTLLLGNESGTLAIYGLYIQPHSRRVVLVELCSQTVGCKQLSQISYDPKTEMVLVTCWDTQWRWFDMLPVSFSEQSGYDNAESVVRVSSVKLICVNELDVANQLVSLNTRNERTGHFMSVPSSLFHSSAITAATCTYSINGVTNFLSGHYNGMITSWTWTTAPHEYVEIPGRSPIIPTKANSKPVSPIFFPKSLFNDSSETFW